MSKQPDCFIGGLSQRVSHRRPAKLFFARNTQQISGNSEDDLPMAKTRTLLHVSKYSMWVNRNQHPYRFSFLGSLNIDDILTTTPRESVHTCTIRFNAYK